MCARTSGANVVTIKNGGDKASNVPSTRAMINDGALVKSGDLVMTHALATSKPTHVPHLRNFHEASTAEWKSVTG